MTSRPTIVLRADVGALVAGPGLRVVVAAVVVRGASYNILEHTTMHIYIYIHICKMVYY